MSLRGSECFSRSLTPLVFTEGGYLDLERAT
jgi:hypothetical protein